MIAFEKKRFYRVSSEKSFFPDWHGRAQIVRFNFKRTVSSEIAMTPLNSCILADSEIGGGRGGPSALRVNKPFCKIENRFRESPPCEMDLG